MPTPSASPAEKPGSKPPSSYDYALIRVVPRVERGEFVNAGAVLFCRTRRFLRVGWRWTAHSCADPFQTAQARHGEPSRFTAWHRRSSSRP